MFSILESESAIAIMERRSLIEWFDQVEHFNDENVQQAEINVPIIDSTVNDDSNHHDSSLVEVNEELRSSKEEGTPEIAQFSVPSNDYSKPSKSDEVFLIESSAVADEVSQVKTKRVKPWRKAQNKLHDEDEPEKRESLVAKRKSSKASLALAFKSTSGLTGHNIITCCLQ